MSNPKITLYTRAECSACDNIKAILRNNKIEYEEKIVGLDVTREEVFDVVGKDPNTKVSLPVGVVDGKHIGSYHEILDWVFPPMEITDE